MEHADLLSLIAAFDQALAGDDGQALREVATDSVEWFVPGRHPLRGAKRGAAEILAYHRLLEQARVRIETLALSAIDGQTVVRLQRATGQAAGVVLDSMELVFYHVQNGRIDRVQVFMGDQHPVDLFYWAAFQLQPIPECLAGSGALS